jgi:hypothetical protein
LDFLPFEEARKFVRNLKLKNQAEWTKYLKSGRKPDYIPYKPERAYRGKWINLGDWLGTGRIANQNRSYKTFDDALQFVRKVILQFLYYVIILALLGQFLIYIPLFLVCRRENQVLANLNASVLSIGLFSVIKYD